MIMAPESVLGGEGASAQIDITFDFRIDSAGKDSDYASPKLRGYHQALWSKTLPSKGELQLQLDEQNYIRAITPMGEMSLTSDSITNSMAGHKALSQIVAQVPEDLVESVKTFGSTIGSRLVFPGDQLEGGKTINVLRGFHPKIRDRFDLTLECIRRHYAGDSSPLKDSLHRYRSFFELFDDFEGYADFFLLQDLVAGNKIRFLTDIDWPRSGSPYPQSAPEYEHYARRTIEFVVARNARILSWARGKSQSAVTERH